MDHLRLGEEVGDEVHTDRFESAFLRRKYTQIRGQPAINSDY